jgi:hypothetical protein
MTKFYEMVIFEYERYVLRFSTILMVRFYNLNLFLQLCPQLKLTNNILKI